MDYQLSKTVIFYPEFDHNADKADCDKIVVELNNPTLTIMQRLKPKTKSTAIVNLDGKTDHMELSIEDDESAILRDMLKSVTNISFSYGGKEKNYIRNAQDLMAAPKFFEPLRKEIIAKAREILRESDVDEKNSE
jgi:hypothetical protein